MTNNTQGMLPVDQCDLVIIVEALEDARLSLDDDGRRRVYDIIDRCEYAMEGETL